MTDTYGDSWNGAFITVLIDGVQEGTYFAKGANSTSNFIAPEGATVQLNYTAGDFEFENSYILYDGSNTQIFTDGTTPAIGTDVFSSTANCSFFNPISGNITMQRYVDAGSTNWRFITSAVSGATLAQFNDDFETSGYPGASYPDWPSVASPWPSTYGYDETQAGAQSVGFTAVSNASNVMNPGEGFWVWSGDTSTGTQPFTFDITGPPNVGDINLPISFTNSGNADDGWNMSGNPFPSTIDWDAIPLTDKTNINNAIYIWNPDNEQFASYSGGIGTNGGSQFIASSQAFWVQATAASPSILVKEASKSSTDASFLKQNSIAPLRIRTQNAYGTDELVINIEDNATSSFDPLYDAEKVASTNSYLPKTSSILNGVDLSINQLNSQEISIPVKILSGFTGMHIITIENAIDFNPSSCLILEDLFTGATYDLSLVDSFSTTVYDTTQTARFLLHIGAPVVIETIDISCFGNNDAKIVYSKNSTTPFDIVWKNNLNNIITSNLNILVSDSITNLSQGIYYIESTDDLCGNSTDTININEPLEISSQFTSNIDTTYLSLGGNVDFSNQSTNAINYLWDFDDLNTSTLNSPSHQYTQPGDYNVTLNAFQDINCYKNSTKVITVIDVTTDVEYFSNLDNTKTFINNNTLSVQGNSLMSVTVRNLLGQFLFISSNQQNQQEFNLSDLSSQTLIITTINNNKLSSIKINFIKK
jgi:hypothetical protein